MVVVEEASLGDAAGELALEDVAEHGAWEVADETPSPRIFLVNGLPKSTSRHLGTWRVGVEDGTASSTCASSSAMLINPTILESKTIRGACERAADAAVAV